MRKGMCILGTSLAAIVCLSGSAALAGGKASRVGPPSDQAVNQAQNDERVKYDVEDSLRTDGRIDWEILDVEVNKGHVTLYGEVETNDQKGLATLLSSDVPGVTEVINRIIVDADVAKNPHLQKAVWRALRNVDALREQTDTMRVRAKGGVVTLSGYVTTKLQKDAAGKAAKSVSGVKTVYNSIHVGGRPFQTAKEKLEKENRQQVP